MSRGLEDTAVVKGLVGGVLRFGTFETLPAPMTAFSIGKKEDLHNFNSDIQNCLVMFNFAVDIMCHFIFELEVATSDPSARCGHGQNRSWTSESDVETVRQYHGNVCVNVCVF